MAGELSKRIGEEGEELARSFLKKIGWIISEENIDIECAYAQDHSRKSGTERKFHGMDFIVAYDCPLVPQTRMNILISMKNSSLEETSNQTSTVKNDLKELDWAMTCYKHSTLRREINQDSTFDIVETGFLIKINKDQDSAESFLKNLTEKERIETSETNEIHYIENSRFDLIDVALKHITSTRRDGSLSYFYAQNPQSYAADIAKIEGSIVPSQHLDAAPLTYRYTEDGIKEFIVISPFDFTVSTLERLVGLAFGCSQDWQGKITIIFPSLTVDDKEKAKGCLRGIRSNPASNNINVESLELRSRLQ